MPRASERVKQFTFKQDHLAQSRRDAEATYKMKQLFRLILWDSAALREDVNFFTVSFARAPAWPRWPWHRLVAAPPQ